MSVRKIKSFSSLGYSREFTTFTCIQSLNLFRVTLHCHKIKISVVNLGKQQGPDRKPSGEKHYDELCRQKIWQAISKGFQNNLQVELSSATMMWSTVWSSSCDRSSKTLRSCAKLKVRRETKAFSLWMQVQVMFPIWIFVLSALPTGEYCTCTTAVSRGHPVASGPQKKKSY